MEAWRSGVLRQSLQTAVLLHSRNTLPCPPSIRNPPSSRVHSPMLLLFCCIAALLQPPRRRGSGTIKFLLGAGGLGGWGLGACGLDGPSALGNRPQPCPPSIRKRCACGFPQGTTLPLRHASNNVVAAPFVFRTHSLVRSCSADGTIGTAGGPNPKSSVFAGFRGAQGILLVIEGY